MVKTILIADDEPENISMLESLLTNRGYKVIMASNGRDAISKALYHHPDLIILDIMMPEMDGTDAAAMLKDDPQTKDTPIFFMTGVIEGDEQKRSQDKPYRMFSKPVKFFELLSAITKV